MGDDDGAIPRTAGRVIVVDAAGDVLLIEERERGAGTRWLTPGGGVEAGEQPAEAAVRELLEETGLVLELPADTPPRHVDHVVWTIDGARFDQTNHYFLTRLGATRPEVRPTALTDYERDSVLRTRWWTPAELAATTGTVYPRGLAGLLEHRDDRGSAA